MFSLPGKYPAVGMFSVTHIISIVICFVLVAVVATLTHKMKKETYLKLLKIFAIVFTCLELFKIVWCLCVGQRRVNNFVPLYFCSLFIYSLWFASSKNLRLRNMGLGFIALAGGIAGAVFIISPSTSFQTYPIFHFQCLYSMIYHSAMVYVCAMFFVTHAEKVNFKFVMSYIYFCLVFMTLAIIVNINFDGNMMFFATPSGIPLPVLFKIYNFNAGLYTVLMMFAHMSLGFIVWGVYALVRLIKSKQRSYDDKKLNC